MATQIKQEAIEYDEQCLPTICDVFSVKREDIKTEEVCAAGSPEDSCQEHNTTAPALGEACEYEEIKIEEFDIDKALLERERRLSIVLRRCDQVSPCEMYIYELGT